MCRLFSAFVDLMVRGKAALCLFCESTSIRGMAKVVRSKTRFLRTLWLCFVILSTGGLLACITLLIFDFLNYDISVQNRVTSESSAFPALSVCHHHPFSQHAYALWANKTVQSPRGFNSFLRRKAYSSLKQEEIDASYNAFFYDSMSIYYQNIPYKYVYDVGHDFDVFRYCVRIHGLVMSIEDDCRNLIGFKMKRFSHNQFFNCYTLEAVDYDASISTHFISLIVSLSREPDYSNYEQGLFMDIFEQAKGLRVVVHEPGTLPDFENGGIHVEPGKFNEISYQPVSWKRMSTPKRHCTKNLTGIVIRDLNSSYFYTYKQCLNQETQRRMMSECKCVYSLYPRVSLPTDKLPYCAAFQPSFDDFQERVKCISTFEFNEDENSSPCQHPCNYFQYETSVSITQWRAQSWQLHWVVLQNNALRHLSEMKNQNKSIKGHTYYNELEEYFTKINLTNITSKGDIKLDDNSFTYVVLKRKTKNVLENTERLVFSLNVLLSRIGGLCSLSIGLTAAFVVEIIEFFYMFHVSQSDHHRHHKDLFAQNDAADNNHNNQKKNTRNRKRSLPTPDNELELHDAKAFLEPNDTPYL